jgi:hypothetical protein
MNMAPQLSMLAGQIACAKTRLEGAKMEARDFATLKSVVRSLRLTYAAQSAGLVPKGRTSPGFVLETDDHREPLVYHGSSEVPVNGAYLKHVLSQAGVELAIGETLLLDAALVQDLIEESLGQLAFEQASVESRKAALEANMPRQHELHLESARALASAESSVAEIRRRKVDLVAASLAAADLMEQKTVILREAVKGPPATAA